LLCARPSTAWYDATHLAIAQAAGYEHWHLAVGADMAKVKAGAVEQGNHYVDNPLNTVVTPQMVVEQIPSYNSASHRNGHLYGAIIASLRAFRDARRKGGYAAYHLGFCAHYVGDLSQPLHHTPKNAFNRRNHHRLDGIIDDTVLANRFKIKPYPIVIRSEADLIQEVTRIANITLRLGRQLEKENRLLTETEAYEQISHSASLLKGILSFVTP
jgi:hypothetical protein